MHVAGEDVWGPSTVVNGSGLPPAHGDLAVKAFGRTCLAGADDGGSGSVLATFTDGSTAVSMHKLGDGSVVRFSWWPGVSHSAAMYPGRDPPSGQARPTMLTDASRWLAVAVALARNPAQTAAATATVDVALVETPVLISSLGAVVTILDWRPAGAADRSTPLLLNVTLPFSPNLVESASAGKLTWTPKGPSSGSWHSGVVEVPPPSATHAADFVSFHSSADTSHAVSVATKTDDSSSVLQYHHRRPTDLRDEFQSIFEAGQGRPSLRVVGNYSCYMNPSALALRRSEHNGTVLAFSEARWPACDDFLCRDGVCGRHDIALRRSTDGGTTFGEMQMVVQVDRDWHSANDSTFNIAPVEDVSTGKILVLYLGSPTQCLNSDLPSTKLLRSGLR